MSFNLTVMRKLITIRCTDRPFGWSLGQQCTFEVNVYFLNFDKWQTIAYLHFLILKARNTISTFHLVLAYQRWQKRISVNLCGILLHLSKKENSSTNIRVKKDFWLFIWLSLCVGMLVAPKRQQVCHRYL